MMTPEEAKILCCKIDEFRKKFSKEFCGLEPDISITLVKRALDNLKTDINSKIVLDKDEE